MPKANAKSQPKIIYPAGVKELNDDLSTDDLVRRLKECAQAFQSMSQDDDNSSYIPLALYLGSEFFLEHPSKDVRLLTACSIADVFRVFAPEAPYKDSDQLKTIFEFFIQQLRGLEDPKDAIFKRYFYLLENLAWVKSFNICIELEENQSIFCQLFTLMFNIVNDNHSTKVKNFMMDMMCPLISEADSVSQELLDIILAQIIEPRKTQNKNAYSLAKDILRRTSSTIEPYIQAFFNNALILGKTSRSDVAHHLYDLIYELNSICPSMLVAVLPQLEFKLKSNEEKERLEVSRLLARMFSDKNSDLAAQNKPLWNCFLGRFNDISAQVRIRCVQYSMHFLINHAELSQDITEQLRLRQHDPEETVRYEVVMAIISAAKKDFSSVSEELLNFVKERTLDKKFKIRKEALLGLATLYKQHSNNSDLPASTLDYISWIRNKVLHGYYQSSLEDRLLVERILHTCLVPYQSSFEERMKKLYQLFASVDDHAVKAFNEMLKCQNIVRCQLSNIVQLIHHPKTEELQRNLSSRIVLLSKNLPEPIKSQEYLRKFCALLGNDKKVQTHLDKILKGSGSCSDIELSVKEVLKSLGLPVQTNTFYMTIRQLLERVAPVMIDHAGINQLLVYIKDSLIGDGTIDKQLGLVSSAHRGLQLLHTLSFIFPGAFDGEEIFTELISFLCADDEYAAEVTLQILTNISEGIGEKYPNVAEQLLPILQNFVECGSVKQAKHAVACISTAVVNKERVFGQIIDNLKQHLTHSSGYFRTALVSIGHIAYHCPDLFGPQMKSIVSKVVVKELLMTDQGDPRDGNELWEEFDKLPVETKTKIEGMKLMVRWLVGLRNAVQSVASTLRLLSSVISHQGDLMENKRMSLMEKSWLRLTAASCMLKLCYEPSYAEAITLEHFQTLCFVICDECEEVREKFALKLHKGLLSLKLPLDFLAAFALCGVEKTQRLKTIFKQYLIANISKRREYLKQHPITTLKLFSILPDYVLPYAIHLLAHDPSFKNYDDVPALNKIKSCLWFLMEPLMTKNENYSFSFFKRLIENIKQTKDKQAPEDDLVNLKLYAVCDLALGLVMSKTTNFVLKDFPVEPSLPSKLFTNLDKMYSNLKTYLPAELAFTPPKKSGIEMEMFGLHMKNVARKSMTVHNIARKESLNESSSVSPDDKKHSRVMLNGEKTDNKRLLEGNENEENICKHLKGNESSKQRILTNKFLQQNQAVKHQLGRRRKLTDVKMSKQNALHSKKGNVSMDSSTSTTNSDAVTKQPRSRQVGLKSRDLSSLGNSIEKKGQRTTAQTNLQNKLTKKGNKILNYLSNSETNVELATRTIEKKLHGRLQKPNSSISSSSPQSDKFSESSFPVTENESPSPIKKQKVNQVKRTQESKNNAASVSRSSTKNTALSNSSDSKRVRNMNSPSTGSPSSLKGKSSGNKSSNVTSSPSSKSDSSGKKSSLQNIVSPISSSNLQKSKNLGHKQSANTTLSSYSQKNKRNKHSASNVSSSSEKNNSTRNKHLVNAISSPLSSHNNNVDSKNIVNSSTNSSSLKGSNLRNRNSSAISLHSTPPISQKSKSLRNKLLTDSTSSVSSSSTSQKSTDYGKTAARLRAKEVSVVIDRLATDRYCKRTKGSHEAESTEHTSIRQSTKASRHNQSNVGKDVKSVSREGTTKSPKVRKRKTSSLETLHQGRSTDRNSTYSQSANVRTPVKQTLPSSPSKVGVTSSPTIISLSASPPNSSCSSPEQKRLRPNTKDSQESERSVKRKLVLSGSAKTVQKGSLSKSLFAKHPSGSTNKESSSRDHQSKRPEVASPAPKSNAHTGMPTRVSERLSAAAKALRKESKSKKLQEFLASRKRRPSVGASSRSPINHKYVKKTKATGVVQKPSNKSKQTVSATTSRKSTSASLLAKAIRSSALTPQNHQTNVQRRQK